MGGQLIFSNRQKNEHPQVSEGILKPLLQFNHPITYPLPQKRREKT